MIKYRMAIGNSPKQARFIASGTVADKGVITLSVPEDAQPGDFIVIEWELESNEHQAKARD